MASQRLVVLCGALALALVGGGVAAAHPPAGDARTLLGRGIALYREASYAKSVAALEEARVKGGLEPAQAVECGFYLGANYLALGSLGAARRELRAVLAAQPDYEPPQYTSPKVAALFRDVREELARAPRLHPLPPERAGGAMRLRFEASRTGGRAFGAVRWRWRGERDFHEAPLAHGPGADELATTVPIDRAGTLEYFAEGRAPAGALAAGSAARPLELPIADAGRAAATGANLVAVRDDGPRRSTARRLWWLWTGLGAVAAAGAGVGLYFALRPQPAGTADAVLDFQVR